MTSTLQLEMQTDNIKIMATFEKSDFIASPDTWLKLNNCLEMKSSTSDAMIALSYKISVKSITQLEDRGTSYLP